MQDLHRIKGLQSADFPADVSMDGPDAVAFRDNIALLTTPSGEQQ
jgi:hypothetical protein